MKKILIVIASVVVISGVVILINVGTVDPGASESIRARANLSSLFGVMEECQRRGGAILGGEGVVCSPESITVPQQGGRVCSVLPDVWPQLPDGFSYSKCAAETSIGGAIAFGVTDGTCIITCDEARGCLTFGC